MLRVPLNQAVFIKRLVLNNFRNYSGVDLFPDSSIILITGENARGKTNLLESIYFASAGKSHRSASCGELIKWGEDYGLARILTEDENSAEKLIEIELKHPNKCRIRINRTDCKKKSELSSVFPSVMFSPDDLSLVKGSPAGRRQYLDDILEKVTPGFDRLKLNYIKILNQRNSLLKSLNSTINPENNKTLEIWDETLIKNGSEIIYARVSLLDEIRTQYKSMVGSFFSDINVEIVYVPSWNRNPADIQSDMAEESKSSGSIAEDIKYQESKNNPNAVINPDLISPDNIRQQFEFALKNNLSRELAYKTTVTGPHRDDFLIRFNGKDFKFFASQGQQRVAALCLKLCEVGIIKNKLKKVPVLLLDDVLSELDIKREKAVLGLIKNSSQTFITASNPNYIRQLQNDYLLKIKKFVVRDNSVVCLPE